MRSNGTGWPEQLKFILARQASCADNRVVGVGHYPTRKAATVVKQIDAKGRIAIGKKFAGGTMLLSRKKDGTIILKPAAVVPANEAWLWNNAKAINSVQRGLKQARAGHFRKGPNLKAAAQLADKIED